MVHCDKAPEGHDLYANLPAVDRKPMTAPALLQAKADGRKIVSLTAYDASFARLLDEAGVDLVLVGDSLGNVIQGLATTIPVSVDDIVYHCRAVSRGLHSALLVADMPFLSAATPERALTNAGRMLAEGGAAMVKLEGAGEMVEITSLLVRHDIPVCAHLGLTPQSVHRLGGYRVQGRDQQARAQLLADARALAEAGASALVLECVPSDLAAEVTANIPIPTIGIGAGVDCDGQILVVHDVLGISPGRRPRFVKDFSEGQYAIRQALAAYVAAVRDGSFPDADHSYAPG
ncbi:MAG: 3-methyl-2-oxobutanoate hydroxymethyltransferase [Xanthomonadales bacterium]|nr:3-methyl-2-oxobutanoate hydroxymethyltransferase [Xanthomonadales bacterium]